MLSLIVLSVVELSSAATIFESGTLGPTGIPRSEIANETVRGTNVGPVVIVGVRFHLDHPVRTTQIGGHFVNNTGANGSFFGAIVALTDESDFPDSGNLSTPDVVGTTALSFPEPSGEVMGQLNESLDPGWYALVFGSGAFAATGSGVAVRNGMDVGDPAYIAFDANLDWFNLNIFQTFFDNHRFVVEGTIVPEPNTLTAVLFLFIVPLLFRFK